jgi:hypothetical protein
MPEHLQMSSGEARPGPQSELVIKAPPDLLIELNRRSLPAAARQHHHQAGIGALIQRLQFGQRLQMRFHPVIPAGPARSLRVLHHHGGPVLRDCDDRWMVPEQFHISHRLALPETQRLLEQVTRGGCIAGPQRRPGPLGKPLVSHQIQVSLVGPKAVSRAGRFQQPTSPVLRPSRIEQAPEPAHV